MFNTTLKVLGWQIDGIGRHEGLKIPWAAVPMSVRVRHLLLKAFFNYLYYEISN